MDMEPGTRHPNLPPSLHQLPPGPWSHILQHLSTADHKALMCTCSATHAAVASSAIERLQINLPPCFTSLPQHTTLPNALTAVTHISLSFPEYPETSPAPFVSWFSRCYRLPLGRLHTLHLKWPEHPSGDELLLQHLRQLVGSCSRLTRLGLSHWRFAQVLEETQPGIGLKHIDALFPPSTSMHTTEDSNAGVTLVGNAVLPSLPSLLLQLTELAVSSYIFSRDELQQLPALRDLQLSYCTFRTRGPVVLPRLLKSLSLRVCDIVEPDDEADDAADNIPGTSDNGGTDRALEIMHNVSVVAPDGSYVSTANQPSGVKIDFILQCIDLSQLPLLENLQLIRCSPLQRLPSSIGTLQHLQTLSLEESSSLPGLPEALCQATNLQELSIRDCQRLAMLPDSLSTLPQLKLLQLSRCPSLGALPACVTHLNSLQTLLLLSLPIHTLPEGMGYLTNLEQLRLQDCRNLMELPETIGQLSSLQELSLQNCRCLVQVPEAVGQLSSLTVLSLQGCPLRELPDSIGQLQQLQQLAVRACYKIVRFPDSIGRLTNLQTADFSHCSSLTSLPESIGKLKELRSLKLDWCGNFRSLPRSISNLQQLSTLSPDSCKRLIRC